MCPLSQNSLNRFVCKYTGVSVSVLYGYRDPPPLLESLNVQILSVLIDPRGLCIRTQKKSDSLNAQTEVDSVSALVQKVVESRKLIQSFLLSNQVKQEEGPDVFDDDDDGEPMDQEDEED